MVKPAGTADADTSAACTASGSTGPPAASTSAAETAAADISVGATSEIAPAVSGASVSVIETTSDYCLPPPSVIFFQSVTEVSHMTPKPSVENTETLTEFIQAAVLASPPAALPFLVTASASARPSSSSGLAKPSRQTSEGTAETPLLTAASGGAPGTDFFGQLIDTNLQGALYEFLSPVGNQPTIDLPRLLQRIRELGYRLPDLLPQAQRSGSGETLREPDDSLEQDWADDRRDDSIDEELQGGCRAAARNRSTWGPSRHVVRRLALRAPCLPSRSLREASSARSSRLRTPPAFPALLSTTKQLLRLLTERGW